MLEFLVIQQTVKQKEEEQDNTENMSKKEVKDLIKKKFARYSLDVNCKITSMTE